VASGEGLGSVKLVTLSQKKVLFIVTAVGRSNAAENIYFQNA
jgi:hypothetical protein